MNILVLGGTRLLGRALVGQLLAAGHEVTIVSRRQAAGMPGVRDVVAERAAGLAQLTGERFDVTFDFIAYDGSGPRTIDAGIEPGVYVLISSTWMLRAVPGLAADQPAGALDPELLARLPAVTQNYLRGKLDAEHAVAARRAQGRAGTVLRLPIFWDVNDHTGRFRFYLDRVCDGHPVIAVDGGENEAQVVWCEDLARSMCAWLPVAAGRPIWEGLPAHPTRVREIIQNIARARGREVRLVDVAAHELRERLPEYLDHEPLWREWPAAPSASNLHVAAQLPLTEPSRWLASLSTRVEPSPPGALRRRELALIEDIGGC